MELYKKGHYLPKKTLTHLKITKKKYVKKWKEDELMGNGIFSMKGNKPLYIFFLCPVQLILFVFLLGIHESNYDVLLQKKWVFFIRVYLFSKYLFFSNVPYY